MKATWKKKLAWSLVAVALSIAASQSVKADNDNKPDKGEKGEKVPDGGATAVLLAGACIGVEALRRKLKRS